VSSWRAGVGAVAVAAVCWLSPDATCVALGLYGGQICWPELAHKGAGVVALACRAGRAGDRFFSVLGCSAAVCGAPVLRPPFFLMLEEACLLAEGRTCVDAIDGRSAGECGLEWLCAAAFSEIEPLSERLRSLAFSREAVVRDLEACVCGGLRSLMPAASVVDLRANCAGSACARAFARRLPAALVLPSD